ncbi:acyl-CoA dehydrogenase [Sphingobium sp. DEHP117]|uniref:acyl-CoA dehydrogenase n=1 Tax=Sphingobium sp. DEHP117 TaxID=2993436 RepID=UPI0027D48441|nr:acyl-CoA dehydrogenase family protein [Sphingobium sp. DEHP117]MDQ4420986.1 acyl-CoA dehydrogenase [Sphingobium sp. DEHP117]
MAGLNHKMGNRGTSNCLLNFGEQEGATGWLIGKPGQGLRQMFTMMNEARISVGMGAAALAYRGYRQSLRYAQERTQGRAQGDKIGPPVAIIEHVDVRRMLLQQKVYAEGALALCLYCANLVDQSDDEAEALLALLTPVAKSWPSEFGLIANDLAIQVHGGYGYTRDFDVEQLWRDNRLNPIHEGTTGIQAIDLLGRKLLLSDGKAIELLRARITQTSERAQAAGRYKKFAWELLSFWKNVADTLDGLKAQAPNTFDDATLFLRAFGHGVIAWLWLDQAMVAAELAETPFHMGIDHACRYFFENDLPQARSWLSVVAQHSTLVRKMPIEAFA